MPFNGNQAALQYLGDGKYVDTSTGHYWTGTSLADAVDRGTSDPGAAGSVAPTPAAAPAQPPATVNWFAQNAPGTPPPTTTAGAGSYNLQQAVDKIKAATGKQLSDPEIDALLAKFGGNRQSTFTDEGLKPVIASLAGGQPTNYGDPKTAPDTYHSNPDAPRYTPLETPAGLQQPYVAPTWTGGDYKDPTKPTSLQSEYTLPTQAELEASPGYATRMAASQRARDMSAASKGTVLSGGSVKASERYAGEQASNEYGNLVGQSLAARGENVAEYGADAGRAYQAYQTRYGQFVDSANMGLGARQQNTSEFNTAQTMNQQTYGNRYQSYLDTNARTLSDYLTNVSTQRNFNNDYWQHLKDINDTGATSANNSYRPPV